MIKKTLKLRLQCQTSREGFTLIEVLIALFIGSLILLTLYASFFQIIKSKDIAESEMQLYHEARVIFSRLNRDFSSVYPRGNVFLNLKNYIAVEPYFEANLEEQDNTSIRFTSISRVPGFNKSDSDQAEIHYYVELDPETELYSLYRSENPYFGEDSNIVSYPISDRVVKFQLSFIKGNILEEDSLSSSWDSNQQNGLPDAVEAYLVLRSLREEDVDFRILFYLNRSD